MDLSISYEIIPVFDIPSKETLADIPKLKQEIIQVCEQNGGEATLAKAMEHKNDLDVAQNFLASLTLAGEGKLQFVGNRQKNSPLKSDELGLKKLD